MATVVKTVVSSGVEEKQRIKVNFLNQQILI